MEIMGKYRITWRRKDGKKKITDVITDDGARASEALRMYYAFAIKEIIKVECINE